MIFSVIIPNFNSTIIDRTLDSLNNQTFSKDQFEVIVVGIDQPGLIRPSNLIRFDQTERKYSPAEARNRGARQARGDILVFIDADCIASEHLLTTYHNWFQDAGIGGMGGGVHLSNENYWTISDNVAMFYEFLDTQSARFVQQLPSLNLAVRQTFFKQVGGFDEKRYPLPAGEDFDLTYRLTLAGCKLFFQPDAWIIHCPQRNSLKAVWRHGYLIGHYSTKIDGRYPEISFPNWIRHKSVLMCLSPFLAFAVASRVFIKNPVLLRVIYTLPAVYISKLAWCFGAANSPFISC